MSAPTPAPGDDRPREGYYPDPSIPGYVRYWNGASWVPGTSRPAPKDGESLAPPPGARPSVEETGPHFFDEDPVDEPPGAASQHGSRPEPATAWGADRSRQSGFADDPNHRVAWPGTAQGADPRVPHARGAGPAGGATAEPGPADAGSGSARPGSGAGAAGGAQAGAASGGPAGAGAGAAGGAQAGRASGGPASAGAGEGAASGTPAGAAGGGSVPGGPAGGGRSADARSAQGDDARSRRSDASAGTASSGETEAGSGNTFVFRRPTAGSQGAQAPGASDGGAATDEGTMTFRAISPRAASGGPGFNAGKAAAARAAAAQAPAPTAPSGPQQTGGPTGPSVPHQAAAPQPAPSQPAAPQPGASAPLAAGPGGGQSSWAQQVHRLAGAGGDEQPVTPWKPPVEDVFQAAARRQAEARPAGLGKRLAARLIDTVVLAGVTGVAAVPLGMKAVDHVNGKIDEAKLSGETVTVWLLDGTTSTYLGIVLAVLLLFGVVYEALPTAKWGRTLGKKLLGLEVRDIEAHEPPSFGAALRRWLVYSVPGLLVVGVVGVAWCLFDRPWHQCWHDKASRTFVAG
ncbi:RDD family protein [Streptomyces thinghirensis]|uniref:RDD family protein n=1 Tax=Streptomyces thinghirensis TaxID=551547 RepID=A0ABP9SW90_9ACTN